VLPEAGAVATVQALESVPVLSTQLENERTQLGNTQSLLTASTQQVTTLESQVSGLNLFISDSKAVCNQQITVLKAEAKRSKRHWFVAGVVTGWLLRQAVKTYTGL
jgi:hypothetical protein